MCGSIPVLRRASRSLVPETPARRKLMDNDGRPRTTWSWYPGRTTASESAKRWPGVPCRGLFPLGRISALQGEWWRNGGGQGRRRLSVLPRPNGALKKPCSCPRQTGQWRPPRRRPAGCRLGLRCPAPRRKPSSTTRSGWGRSHGPTVAGCIRPGTGVREAHILLLAAASRWTIAPRCCIVKAGNNGSPLDVREQESLSHEPNQYHLR